MAFLCDQLQLAGVRRSACRFSWHESVFEADLFRPVPGAGQFCSAARQGSRLPRAERTRLPRMPVGNICSAVDMACIWYWKEVLCLQRSAATACLLKKYGVPAQMVIGAQQMPFKAHAWVEVDGRVVNDKPYMREMYAVLDQVLECFVAVAAKGTIMSVQFGRWNFDGKPVDRTISKR